MIAGTSIDLRPVAAGDLRQLRVWEQSAEVAYGLGTIASAIDARESPEQEFDRLLRTPRVKLLAIQTKDATLVGLLRLNDLDLTHRKAQLRLFLAPEFQAHGYGFDALRTVARFCFAELGLHRLGLLVRADNLHARRLYERLGFQVEGCEREAIWSGGTWIDFVGMGLLAADWWSSEAQQSDPDHSAARTGTGATDA